MAKQTTKKTTEKKKPELVKVRMLKDKYVGNKVYRNGTIHEVTADTARVWTNPNKKTAERV